MHMQCKTYLSLQLYAKKIYNDGKQNKVMHDCALVQRGSADCPVPVEAGVGTVSIRQHGSAVYVGMVVVVCIP